MTDETPQDELVRLRVEVESHRQRELADLRAALSAARGEAAHYRQEAIRLDVAAREIAAEGQAQIAALRMKLQATNSARASERPPLVRANGN